MDRLKLATVWLGGCSGCHMSFLDLDEWLFRLAELADIVYSPVIDTKEYPDGVDLCLVEGAVANQDNLELALRLRRCTRRVVAFGDCAVTGNVTALRNPLGDAQAVLARSYLDASALRPAIPREAGVVPPLLDQVLPLHQVIDVDCFLPGCPPSAERIRTLLEQLFGPAGVHLEPKNLTFG